MRRSHRHGFSSSTFASVTAVSTGPKIERYRAWLEEGREPPPVRLTRAGEMLLLTVATGSPTPASRATC